MNNQNGIVEQNEVIKPVEVVENNSFSSNEAATTPHDLSRIQELVNQLESKIQKINTGDSEAKTSFDMEAIYQKSIQDGTMKQVVQGEIYVGKNPTLARFVEEAKQNVLPMLKSQMGMNEMSFSDSNNSSIPNLELTSPIEFGELKKETPAPIGISSPPLRPENIFDEEEIIGEENSQRLGGESYQERSKVA